MSIRAASGPFTFLWRIENFSYCTQKKGESLQSPQFVVNTLYKTQWNLELYPKGKTDEKYIVCFLERAQCDSGPLDVPMTCEFSFLAADNSPRKSVKLEDQKCVSRQCHGICAVVSADEVMKKKRAVFLPLDTLTIRFRMWNHELSIPVDSQARTRIGVERRSFTWTVKEFSTLVPGKLLSTLVPTTCDQPFYLTMTCQLSEQPSKRIRIGFKNHVNATIYFTCKISFLDTDGSVLLVAEDTHLFDGVQNWLLPAVITQSQLMAEKDSCLPNDELSLQCDIAISNGIQLNLIESSVFGKTTSQNEHSVESAATDQGSLRNDLFGLYADGKFCDIVLRAESTTYPVHKAVLCARSSVFSAILNVQIVEITDGVQIVQIPDLDSDTLSRLLIFIYSDVLDVSHFESALRLYSAAEKYQIDSLKVRCSLFLKSIISANNVGGMLVFADAHKDRDLKTASQDFIILNEDEIFPSERWKRFAETKYVLSAEIMQLIYRKRREDLLSVPAGTSSS